MLFKKSRKHLNDAIMRLVSEDQNAMSTENEPWVFTPALASQIINKVFDMERRKSGRLVKCHMFAVAGLGTSGETQNPNIHDEDRILRLFHDLFEDTQLEPQDSLKWGIDYDTYQKINLLTRSEDKKSGAREPYCDYIEILSNDAECVDAKLDDAIDNLEFDPPNRNKQKLKKEVTICYLRAIQQSIISPGTSFKSFASQHPEHLPLGRTQKEALKWINDNSSSLKNIGQWNYNHK